MDLLSALQLAFADAWRAFSYRPWPMVLYHAVMLAAGAWLAVRLFRKGPGASFLGAVGWGAVSFVLAMMLAVIINPFVGMNALAGAVFIELPLLLLSFAAAQKRWWQLLVLIAPAVVLWAIAFQAFVIEPTSLEVEHAEVKSHKLDRRYRVVIISDLQFDRITSYERRALTIAAEAKPDLLLFPGDYVQLPTRLGGDALRKQANQLLHELGLTRVPYGIYAVQGNVEMGQHWQPLFEGLNADLFNQMGRVERGGITVTGFGLMESYRTDLLVPPANGFHIALGHVPNFALGEIHADLLVAGHTHGGQVQLPGIGPLITFSSVPRAWAAGGVTQLPPTAHLPEERTLIVSRGVGTERDSAPRLRFLCRPQLWVLELVPAGP